MSPTQTQTLLKIVASQQTLHKAWRTVRQSSLASKSEEIQNSAKRFDEDGPKNIRSIQSRLTRNTFIFQPAIGVLKKRPGKTPRGLVVSPIESRIVQRALLDTLCEQDKIKPLVMTQNSFGGVRGGKVRTAIEKLCTEISNGATHYYKSDIHNFFPSISRISVLDTISRLLPDTTINKLLHEAVKCELENASRPDIAAVIDIYPNDEIGVMQGSCLSPLFGNIFLHDFDVEMNSNISTHCLRYVDDFIIIGEDQGSVMRQASKATRILKGLGLSTYTLRDNNSKASAGPISRGVDFLGCRIWPGRIRPGDKATTAIISKVKNMLDESIFSIQHMQDNFSVKKSFAYTLRLVSETVRGWGNSFSFCSDDDYFKKFDSEICKHVSLYTTKFFDIYNNTTDTALRHKLLALHCASDCINNPIYSKKVPRRLANRP